MSEPDPHQFRNALGQFATGVTIVTTLDNDAKPVGVTASSFNSVSLDPPLVLWSLAKTAHSMPAYQNSGGFNVHVLASHQSDLSNQFARPSDDKFKDIDWVPCENGFPLLPEYAALFRCKTHFQYEGGDHIIFVGEVIEYQTHNFPVLVFHGGKYAEAKQKSAPATPARPGVDLNSGQFSDDFLLYLLSRAHFQTSYPTRKACREIGMSEAEYFCLSLLAMSGSLSEDDIVIRLEHTGHHPDAEIFARLLRKSWINRDGKNVHISESGRETFIKLLAHSKALEEQLLKHFTDEELAEASKFMKRLIDITGSDIPELW
ncbi:flavin reductase [Hellea balneolensis]|uniref:flavin reductase n=1 Tax=Hellea balneolensis TaxID=287478 RepID=UPI0004161A72|nr:flavin reductase [Hellea balneolensis]